MIIQYGAAFEIDSEVVVVDRVCARGEFSDFAFRQGNRKNSVLRAIVHEDVRERGREDSAESIVEQRPRRVLTRRAAAEVSTSEKDSCACVTRMI